MVESYRLGIRGISYDPSEITQEKVGEIRLGIGGIFWDPSDSRYEPFRGDKPDDVRVVGYIPANRHSGILLVRADKTLVALILGN